MLSSITVPQSPQINPSLVCLSFSLPHSGHDFISILIKRINLILKFFVVMKKLFFKKQFCHDFEVKNEKEKFKNVQREKYRFKARKNKVKLW